MSYLDSVPVIAGADLSDDEQYKAVLFFLENDEPEWIPRSLLKSFDDDEMWIPKWKAEELGVDYE